MKISRPLIPLIISLVFSSAGFAATAAAPPRLLVEVGAQNLLAGTRQTVLSGEYRSAPRFHHIGAMAIAERTAEERFIGVGGFRTFGIHGTLLTIEGSPGYYQRTRNGFDLGSRWEFRTAIDWSLSLSHNVTVGLGIAHISNAGTGYKNPGTEAVRLLIGVPLRR